MERVYVIFSLYNIRLRKSRAHYSPLIIQSFWSLRLLGGCGQNRIEKIASLGLLDSSPTDDVNYACPHNPVPRCLKHIILVRMGPSPGPFSVENHRVFRQPYVFHH